MVLSDSPAGPAVGGRSPDPPTNGTASRAATEIQFRPVHPLGAVTWLGESAGEWVAARPLPFLVDGSPGREHVAVARLPRIPREAGSQHLIRFTGVAVADGTPWAVSQYVPGAPLDRLLTVATLTPRQATTVAVEVFAGLASLHAGGLVHGRLTPRTVRIGADGVVRLSDWAVRTLDRMAGPGLPDRADDPATAAGVLADLEAARRIVADLARNADRPVVHRGGLDAELIAGLARMAASDAREAAAAKAELRHLLDDAGGGASIRPNVHAELAALVAAANLRLPETSRTPWAGSGSDDPAAPIRPGARRLQRGRLSGADWHVPRRRRAVWGAAATVAVLAAGALALTVGPGRSVGDRILNRQPSASTPSGGASTSSAAAGLAGRPRRAPSVAAAAAGIVHGVSARAVTRCAPGKPCRLRVAVRITPAPSLRRLRWAVSVYDRCTGVRSSQPGGLLIAAPGATSVGTTRTVTLPAGRALAVSALTTRPVRAASAPLLVPASARTC